MRVFIATQDQEERAALSKMFKQHLWTVDAPKDFSKDYDTVLGCEYDTVVGSDAHHFSERAGLVIAEDVGNFDVFSAQFAKAGGHPATVIGILTATQGENTLSLDMLDTRDQFALIDAKKTTVRVNGEGKHLAPGEYKLLRQFMEMPNTSISKDVLAARAGMSEDAVKVRVSHLRKKIPPFEIKPDHNGGFSFANDSYVDNILVHAHGITVSADRRFTYNNDIKDVPLDLKKGQNLLIDLLKGVRPDVTPTNVTLMSHIKQALAMASACDDAPHGYDFFTADSSRYRLRKTPVALKPKLEPKGMLFSLGDGHLVVDTNKQIMENTRTRAVCSISRQQARFLEILALYQDEDALTTSTLGKAHHIPGANMVFSFLCGKIDNDLGLRSELYLESGTRSRPGYRAINVNDFSGELDQDVGMDEGHAAPAQTLVAE